MPDQDSDQRAELHAAQLRESGQMEFKTWEQLTPNERIERLRDCLRSKDMAIQDLRDQVARLSQHQHGPHGELLTPIYMLYGQPVSQVGRFFDPLA